VILSRRRRERARAYALNICAMARFFLAFCLRWLAEVPILGLAEKMQAGADWLEGRP
jgi:hypothetical protein